MPPVLNRRLVVTEAALERGGWSHLAAVLAEADVPNPATVEASIYREAVVITARSLDD